MSSTRQAAPGSRLLAAVVLSACVGLVGGGLAAWGVYAHFGPVERVITQNKTGGTAVSIGDIASAAQVGVVTISTSAASRADLAAGSVSGLAEGVAVSSDGLILTTARAVRGASLLRVATADGHAFDATIAGSNTAAGLVVLRAAGASGLQTLRLATPAPRIGDLAVVVSRPALGPLSARSGVVAATGLSAGDGVAQVVDLFALDATPAPEAEGAPVVDGTGAVTGLVSEIPGAPGVMAVSGRDAAALVSAVPGAGQASRPTFGIAAQVLSAATAAATGLPPGALVRAVDPAGPAAGLVAVGDVVTQVNGAPVGPQGLDPVLFGLAAGQSAALAVVGADGISHTVSLVVASST